MTNLDLVSVRSMESFNGEQREGSGVADEGALDGILVPRLKWCPKGDRLQEGGVGRAPDVQAGERGQDRQARVVVHWRHGGDDHGRHRAAPCIPCLVARLSAGCR